MRVLIINTSERIGGAAIAANRLMEALKIVVESMAIHLGTCRYLASQPLQET